MSVETALPKDGSLDSSALCLHDGRWFRSGIVAPRNATGSDPKRVEARVRIENETPKMCEVDVTIHGRRDGSRAQTVCFDNESKRVSKGKCSRGPERPADGHGPVSVEDVTVRDGGVHYLLRANETLPVHHEKPNASIETRIECSNGQRDRHGRPLSRDVLRLGEYRRFGSIFSPTKWPEGLALPCTVTLQWQVSDDYDRESEVLFEGCVDRSGTELGACDSKPPHQRG